MKNYIVIGDSITYGIGDYENGGWATLFKKYILSKDSSKACSNYVHIAGFPGATSEDILAKLDSILDCYNDNELSNVIILSIGINDSKYFSGDFEKSKYNYKENMENIIKKITERGFSLIILGLTKIVLDETGSEYSFYTNSNIGEYEIDLRIIMENDEVLEELCSKKKIKYISLRNILTSDDYIDGLHPNTSGHKKICEVVKNVIEF